MQLNPEQRRVVDHDGHCLVVACPGSGKTRVITTKIGALLARHPNARICAVTFTRDASRELERRVITEIGSEAFRRHCKVGTFHSLAIRHLRAANLIKKIASPAEQRAYLFRAMNQLDPLLTFEEASQIIEKAKTTFGDCPEKSSELFQAYSEMLTRNRVEDLYDVMRRSVESMQSGALKPIAVDFMLVDEFQDTDHIQLAWVLEHAKVGANITVVGDDDQSVYGWRGALGYHGMTEFSSRTGGEHITLGINYRCRSEILSAADLLIRHNEARIVKDLYAERGAGGSVSSRRYPCRISEADAVVTEIEQEAESVSRGSGLFHKTVPGGDWAVLARNNFLLDGVEVALQAQGVQYYRSGNESLWNRQPFVSMLALMRSIQTGATDGVDLALSQAMGARIGKALAGHTLDLLHAELGSDFSHLLDGAPAPYSKLDSEAAAIVRSFCNCAVGWRNNVRNGRYGTTCRGIAAWFAGFEDKGGKAALVCSLGEVAANLNGSLVKRAAALSMPVANSDDQGMPPGVHLYTMHSSKGLEFKRVWIIGTDAETLPAPRALDYDEERRLMYVAMTRARDKLYLSSIITSKPSAFVEEACCMPEQTST